MTEVMKMTKKVVTSAVVATTIAWSVSLSAFLAPLTAKAAVTPGTLVKASLPAVYYVGQDGKRYVFPNEKTYKTWYADFSGVVVITDAELASLMIGGNVTYKPGVLMVKITTDPKVYAVDAHGVLRPIASEAVAAALYGSNWNTMIHDVPDAFFTNYSVGSAINSASDFNPASASAAATSINQDKNLGSGSVTGSVSVMLSSSQPAGGTVPQGATAVNVLKFDVRNSSSSATTLSSLTVHRAGPGQADDFNAVYVYDGSTRLTTGRTINTTTNDATFSSLNLSLAAGQTKTLWIGVDWDMDTDGVGTPPDTSTAESGNVSSFSVTSVMVGGSSAVGTPVSGPSFTTAGVAVGSVTFDDAGTVSSVKAGGMQQKVASFRITAPSNEDMDFSSIALMQNGSVNRGDLSNLTLKQAGLTLATTSALTEKDLAVFTLSPAMYLERGATRTFEVFADVSAAVDASDDIEFALDENSDLHATGRTYGYGLQVNSTSFSSQEVDIEAGKLTVTFNGPSAHDVAVNGKDVELFNFTVAAQSNLEIRQTDLRVETSGDDVVDLIRDLKIVETSNGTLIAGPKEGTETDGDQDFSFTETWNLNAGQSRTFKVTADIPNDSFLDGDTIRVTLGAFGAGPCETPATTCIFTENKVRNLDASEYLVLSDMVPNVPITGNLNTVNDSSLEVLDASTPVSQTYIQGTQGAAIAGFGLQAGDAGDVKVNSLVLNSFISDADGSYNEGGAGIDNDGGTSASISNSVLSAKLWNGSTQIGETEAPNSNGVLTFDNLNLTIPSGQTLNLTLTVNLAGSIASVNEDGEDYMYWSLDDGDIDATNLDGDLVTVTGGTPESNTMTIATSGVLTAERAPDDTESEDANVVGGASNVVLAKYKFTSQREEMKVTKLRLTTSGVTGVASLSLYDGSTLVGGPVSVNGSGQANFSSVNFVVPKDGTKTLTVKANLNSVGASGASTGTNVGVTLDSTTNFEARGTGAGSSTTQTSFTGGNIAGRDKLLRKTKPTVSLVALPTTTLINGDVTSLRFSISADAAGDVAVRGFRVEITPTAGVTVTDTADSSVRRVGDGSNRPGDASFIGNILGVTFTDEEVISAGTTRTFDVRVNLSGVNGDDSLSSRLLGDSGLETGTVNDANTNQYLGLGGSNDEYNFVWSDISQIPHDGTLTGSTSADWTNGTYVKTLPTDNQTMTQ